LRQDEFRVLSAEEFILKVRGTLSIAWSTWSEAATATGCGGWRPAIGYRDRSQLHQQLNYKKGNLFV
jgi:hypothetical protein